MTTPVVEDKVIVASELTPPPSSGARFSIGDVVDGRYRVIAPLATGGMGEVYKVEHIALGKALALKVMIAGRMTDPDLVERFKLEALSASRIGHPNIIDVSDLGQTKDGVLYFVMELVGGDTLTTIAETQGALPPLRVIEIGTEIAEALGAAHRHGIVHRDLKPDNVMITPKPGGKESLKVLDFGIARVKRDSHGHTAVGHVLGTPAYMAPEQAQAHALDGRADIYSLGVILHELLTGKPAFVGDTPHMVMVKQVHEPPPPLPATVPPRLSALIGRMLKKGPADRPQTMAEVIEALAAAREEADPSAKTPRGLLIGFGVVVALVIGVVVVTMNEPEPTALPVKPLPNLAAPPKAPPTPQPLPEVAAPTLAAAEVTKLVEQGDYWLTHVNWKRANDSAEACITADPMRVDCYAIAGASAEELGDLEGAKNRYVRFMELAPKDHPRRKAVAEALAKYFRLQGK